MSAKAKSKLTPEQRNATLRRVLEKIRPYGFFVVCSLIVAAVSVAAQLYIPILCGSAIDMMLGKGNVDFNGVLRIVVEIVIVAVVAALAQWLLSVCNNRITFSVSRDLRNAALRKIQTLPLSYLDSHPSGDIVSRMVADVDTFADGLLMGFTQLFSGVLTILGTLLFMLSENVPITLVVVCITPLSLVVASFLAKRSYGYFQSQSAVRGEQTALVNEMIEGQKVVQAFGHEAESLAAFDEVNGRLQNVSLKAIFFSSMTNPATRFVNNIVYAGVGLVGAVYAVAGGITIGQLSIFLNYANQYTKPFNEISGVVTELQNALASAERVFHLIEEPRQTPDAPDAPVLSSPSTENFFKIFNSYVSLVKTYEPTYSSFDFPSFGSFKSVERFASNSNMKSQAISPALLRATFTDAAGTKGEGLFTADIIDFAGNMMSGFGIDAGYYMAYNIAAITCEENSLIEWKDILCQSLSSIDYSQSYVNSAIQQSNESTANAMQIRNELSSISDGIMDSWEKRNTSQDIISQKQSDATLGLERIYDTEKDEIYMAKNGWSDTNKDERFQLVTDDSMYLKATSGTIE